MNAAIVNFSPIPLPERILDIRDHTSYPKEFISGVYYDVGGRKVERSTTFWHAIFFEL